MPRQAGNMPTLPRLPSLGRILTARTPLPKAPKQQPHQESLIEQARMDLVASGMIATLPEFLVYRWLVRHGFVDGIDFDFQSSLAGGRLSLGAVADFIVYTAAGAGPRGLIIRVQGEHWHYTIPGARAKDNEQKLRLVEQGFTVVDVDEFDTYERLDSIMQDALVGIDRSKGMMGVT